MNERDSHTLKFAFERCLRKYANRTAVICGGSTYTYREIDTGSNALANELVNLGVRVDDRVAVMMTNRIEYVIARLAIIKAGATLMPINPDLSTQEIDYMLSGPDVQYVICDDDSIGHLESLDDAGDRFEHVIVAGSASEGRPPNYSDYESHVDSGDGSTPPLVEVTGDNFAGHHYTGGTTGKPKGVLFTERSRLTNLFANMFELDIKTTDTLLLSTPVAHAARVFLKAGLLSGATIVLREGFDVEQTFRDIETQEISWTFMVPTMIHRLLEGFDDYEFDISSMETFVYGAAPISPTDLQDALEIFGPVFIQLYGQTEVPNLISTLGKQEHRYGLEHKESILQSAGQPCLMADVKIVDSTSGEVQSVGNVGEIVAKAPYTMERYFDLPEKTAETMDDGWVHTGDIGRFDEDGYLYLLDRESDMIITGGLNVYSVEVEDVLVEHPAVAEIAVIGIPDDEWGEAIMAYIVPDALDSDRDAVRSEIFEFAAENLSAYKKPKRIEFVDTLPKTKYGKIDKTALRDRHWDGERNIH